MSTTREDAVARAIYHHDLAGHEGDPEAWPWPPPLREVENAYLGRARAAIAALRLEDGG